MLLLAALSGAGCNRSRTASRAVPPTTALTRTAAPSRTPGTQPPERSTETTARCNSVAGALAANGTRTLLSRLDATMADFEPPADSFAYGSEDPACLTEVAIQNDPARAASERLRVQAVQQSERRARVAYRQRSETLRSLAWIWDPGWETRYVDQREVGRCWNNTQQRYCTAGQSCAASRAECNEDGRGPFEWHVVQAEVHGNPYTLDGRVQAPALTTRTVASHVEMDQEVFCLVRAAVIVGSAGLLTCDGAERAPAYEIRVPLETVTPGGVLSNLVVGDLVRARRPFIARKLFAPDPRGIWRFEATTEGLAVTEASSCCRVRPPSVPTEPATEVEAPAEGVNQAEPRGTRARPRSPSRSASPY